MNQVGKAMAGVVKNLDPLLKTMDLAKMTAVMDKFAELDEDFAVRDSVMQGKKFKNQTKLKIEFSILLFFLLSFVLACSLNLIFSPMSQHPNSNYENEFTTI